jgi:hypothetical protein
VSEEDKKDGPDYISTKQIPAMTDRALLNDLYKVTKDMATEVSKVSQTQIAMDEKVDKLSLDVEGLQQWRKETEYRQSKHSGGVRQLSETDAKHDAAMGALLATQVDHSTQLEHQTNILHEHTVAIAANTALTTKIKTDTEAQTAILKTIAEHPMVKKLALGAVTLLGICITYLTLRMTQKVESIEHKPQTVQPAPTVYLPISAFDGGVK